MAVRLAAADLISEEHDMIYAAAGFLFGFFIPYISRRFAKFMPANMAYGIYRIFKQNSRVGAQKRKQSWQYSKLVSQYFWRSIVWGLLCGGLSFMALHFWGDFHIFWYLAFIWILLLLAEIDWRIMLLPDILTIPLLILGFAFAAIYGVWTPAIDSALGALAGYFLPVAVALLFVWKSRDAFGGGDVKFLAALGAWLGLEKLLIAIVLACIVFGLHALIKRQRTGAFGPALSAAAIAIAFYFF